jgi:glucosamine--fructose-6-phosphate aminotransferase (isomerizing)
MQRAARRAGALTLALVNDSASPLAIEAERFMPLEAGVERSVAATKSAIAGLVASASLVAAWSADRALGEALASLPGILRASEAPAPPAFVDRLAQARSAFVIGRGATLAIAAEAALKLKETCGIHAEAFSAAEVLHGPAELIRPGFPVIAFVPRDEARAGFLETTVRLKTMGADILYVDGERESGPLSLATADPGHPYLAPIPMIHRFYRVAEATARALGRDPDAPRNLRKVTTTL